MSYVKINKPSKTHSLLQDFAEEFMKSSSNKLYCNLCRCTVSCLLKLIEILYVQTPKSVRQQISATIPHTFQTFLRSSNTDVVEKLAKAFLFADIPLYMLNNEHITNLFRDIVHSLPSETTC